MQPVLDALAARVEALESAAPRLLVIDRDGKPFGGELPAQRHPMLETMSGMKFPDAEMVGNAMARLLDVIERYELVGKWVSLVSNKEICEVSTFMHSLSSSIICDL